MADMIYTLKGPDGKTYDVQGPQGASSEQLSAELSKALASGVEVPMLETPNVLARLAKVAAGGFTRGALGQAAPLAESEYAQSSLVLGRPELEGQLPPFGIHEKGVQSIGPRAATKGEGYVSSTAEALGGGMTSPNPVAEGGKAAVVKSLLKLAAISGATGLGSEGAAQTLGDNPISRIIGALLSGGLTSYGLSRVPTAKSIIRKDLSAVDADDIAKALEMEKTLKSEGIPHAASQLLGPKSTMADTMERASGNQFVRPQVLGKLDEAPEKAAGAFSSWMQKHLPPTGATSRQVLPDVQSEAASRIQQLKHEANAAFEAALPEGTSAQIIPRERLVSGIKALRERAADPNYHGPLTPGGKFLQGIADDIEALMKSDTPLRLGDINNLAKTESLSSAATKAGYQGVATRDAMDILKSMTPEFDAARAAKNAFMKGTVNPVQQGLTGQLAQMGGGVRPDKYTATKSAIPMTIAKDRVQTAEIAELSKQIGPDNVTALLQEHLTSAKNSALKPALSLAEEVRQPFFIQANARGAKGTALRANVDASLREAATSYGIPAKELQGSFHKLMDALESFKDLKIAGGVDKASIDQAAGRNLLSAAVAPASRSGRYIQDAVMARTYRKIAGMAMSPEGVKLLIAVGKSKDPSVVPAFIKAVLATDAPDLPEQSTP